MYKYSETKSLVNVSSSILKRFGVCPYHPSLKVLDDVLEANRDKKVVLFLFDGLSKEILKKHKDVARYIRQNRFKLITSVFPPTTVAATTSLLSGLYPAETGWLGWFTRWDEKVLVTFTSTLADDSGKLEPGFETLIPYNSIIDLINKAHEREVAKDIYSFKLPNKSIEGFFEAVDEEVEQRNFVYAYCTEPDHLMHINGTQHPDVKDAIRRINNRLQEFVKAHPDCLVISLADHGMRDCVEAVIPEDFKRVVGSSMSIECRATSLVVKEEDRAEFLRLYRQYFEKDFELYDRNAVIEKRLFGLMDYESPVFRRLIGDYLMVAVGDRTLNLLGPNPNRGDHAGGTKGEMEIIISVYNNI